MSAPTKSSLSEPASSLTDPRLHLQRDPILIILHQERSSPGRVGQMLVEKGFPLDIRRPALGDALPQTLARHSGAVIFGGPMSVNDEHDYVKAEIDWVSVPLSEGKPFFGICLGAQMLVRQLGGVVEPHGDGHTEIGWYPINPTEAGRALMDWPEHVYQFHLEGFELPRGAELLAQSSLYPNQAFRYGANAYGIQFHAELTRAMMQRWVVHGAHRFDLPNAQIGRQHLEGRFLYDAPLRLWLSHMLDLIFVDGQPQAVAASRCA